MAWLCPKLSNRVQIGTPTQEPNDSGGFDFSFSHELTTWMGFKPLGYRTSGAKYIRGKQVSEAATHEFQCRYLSVASFGKAFTKGFSKGFDSIADLTPLKSDYFLFVEKGSSSKGRLFKILEIMNNNEQDEYLSLVAEEIEERGTGYQA